MKFYVFCLLLLSLYFSATARSFVPRHEIIERLKTLRNIISNTASLGHGFRSYQDSCHSIINDAISHINGMDAAFTLSYQQSLEVLIEMAGQMRFYRRSKKFILLRTIYAHLVNTLKPSPADRFLLHPLTNTL